MKTRTRKNQTKPLQINPHVFSLMTIPFPVFVTNRDGKVVPTITAPEFAQLTRYKE